MDNRGFNVLKIGENGYSMPKAYTTHGFYRIQFGSDITDIPDEIFANNKILQIVELTNNIKTIGASAFGGCTKIEAIYLSTNESQYEAVLKNNIGNYNKCFTDNVKFYSETQPTENLENYWHYDSDGVTPVIWSAE